MLHDDPDFLQLESRVFALETRIKTVLELLDKLDKLSSRLERFMIGGWDESSGQFVSGFNKKIDRVDAYMTWGVRGVWTLVTLAAGDAIAMLFRH